MSGVIRQLVCIETSYFSGLRGCIFSQKSFPCSVFQFGKVICLKILMCVCVCVCVCIRESGEGREGEREKVKCE